MNECSHPLRGPCLFPMSAQRSPRAERCSGTPARLHRLFQNPLRSDVLSFPLYRLSLPEVFLGPDTDRTSVKPHVFLQVRSAPRPADSRSFDSRSSSTISSDVPVSTKPLPPPVAQKPSFTVKTGPADDTTSNDPAEDPASRTFRGKVKAFEQMDNLARAKRMQELQEAELARVCDLIHTNYTKEPH